MNLWPHQQIAVDRARDQSNLALFMPPGVGKTGTTIHIIREEFNKHQRHLPTLVVGPQITINQWKAEFAKFSKIPRDRIIALPTSGTKRLKDFETARKKFDGGIVVVTNYEAFLTKAFCEAIGDWAPHILVLDESHRVKNPSSQRVKALRPIAEKATRRFILTGTPVLNSPMDLFSQYLLLDNGETFGKNFFTFRMQYFYDKNAHMPRQRYFPCWEIRKDALAAINAKLQATSVQAKKEECLKLPPLVEVDIPTPLGKEQEKAYKDLEKHFIAFVKDKTVTADLAITKTLRMRQALAGFLLPDHDPNWDRKPIYFEENPRLQALTEKTELLVESGGKVIIWTDFQATYDMISKALTKLKIDHVFLTGRESAKQKTENVAAFTKGDVPVAICNPAAVGLGVNLTEAKYSIYYTRGFSFGEKDQSMARNYRGGSDMHDSVTHYSIFVENTLDEVIRKALESKESIADAVLAWGVSST
jgi:SNF2 family DNA or RNA helicase